MPDLLKSTGDPNLDEVLRLSAVRAVIAQRIRYGQTRYIEALLASIMIAIGVAFLAPGDTVSLPSFRVIRAFVNETTAGWIAFGVGMLRLWALWANGSVRETPAIRVVGCIGGIAFWTAWGIGLYRTSPPLVPMAPAAAVFALFEIAALRLATRDLYIFNSFGIRRRLRGAGNGAS